MFVRRAVSRIMARLRAFWRAAYGPSVEGDEMSPFVRVSCEPCREDVDVPFADVRLICYENDVEWIGYRCPQCRSHGMTPLPTAYSRSAHRAGFPIVKMPTPAQIDAAPITEDELIEFGLALERAEEISL